MRPSFPAMRTGGALLVLALIGTLLEGCAGGLASRVEIQPSGDFSGEPARTAKASLAPPPLQPLERLPATPRSEARSTVMPVVSDGSIDPEEEAVEPGLEFERGGASWYGSRFHGRRTASGERFDTSEMTAAHRTLPFGTPVCVRNVGSGQTVLVRVNDRGPSTRSRVIDISQAAAEKLGMVGAGVQIVALSRPVSGRMRCE